MCENSSKEKGSPGTGGSTADWIALKAIWPFELDELYMCVCVLAVRISL